MQGRSTARSAGLSTGRSKRPQKRAQNGEKETEAKNGEYEQTYGLTGQEMECLQEREEAELRECRFRPHINLYRAEVSAYSNK